MSDMPERHPLTLKRLAYRITGMESVPVRGDLEYASDDAGPRLLDVYHPIDPARRPPVVVIVAGYPDVGVPRRLGCAFKSGGFTFDATGSAVADAARTYGFVNASAGHSAADLPADVPLFLARCGGDEFAGLNDALDRFVADALARNLPVTLVNHRSARHGFELHDDSDAGKEVMRQMLEFMRFHLDA